MATGNALNLIKKITLMKCKRREKRWGKWRKVDENLPSELDDFSASVCAANAFVRSNKSSWNCFESVVGVDKSTDLKILQTRKENWVNIKSDSSKDEM